MFFPLRLGPNKYPFPQAMVNVIIGGIAVLFINSFYAGLFGDYFNNLLREGMAFNWLLFLGVTVVIFMFRAFLGKGKTKRGGKIDRKIRGWINLRMYLLRKSIVDRIRIVPT